MPESTAPQTIQTLLNRSVCLFCGFSGLNDRFAAITVSKILTAQTLMVCLQSVLDYAQISPIQAAIAIHNQTDESLNAVSTRLRRWLNGKPPALPVVERDLSIIGWRLLLEPLPEKTDLAKAKADYARIVGFMKTAKPQARPMIRSKALSVLAEIRKEMAGQCKPPDLEALQWWLDCDLVGTIEWWWDYYREQAIRAQRADSEGWDAIARARYSLAVIKRLEIGRSGESSDRPAH